MKEKNLQIHLTEDEYNAVRSAARRAGRTASQFGADVVLGAVLQDRKKEPEVLEALQSFQQIFCEAMELNLEHKLTPTRFRGLVERRSVKS